MYNCLENHDLVLDADGDHRHPRVPALADPENSRSWYACSRSRVATGLLLTAPGVPMFFMGQEFLEDKLWSDDPNRADHFIAWEGLEDPDRTMADFHRFSRDLVWLRRTQPALRAGSVNAYHLDPSNRVLAFHRWIPGEGRDLVIVTSLAESTANGYGLGFPLPGRWTEVFNSDFYDHFPNPWVQGNNGTAVAQSPAMHGLPSSASITIPANSVLVFARDSTA
jgi:1,4-alpha-glucan branching enzyme